ncbi:2'-5' RNA ligase [Luteibacter rhizovicinus]|uniref:2'-5' RNA ligase n=1 Tax=Luteibacter rhizovicinus TaxID=242606 RepID=A0A4R3YLX0_9GAMM|nr:2'-5' RNA ligase family protein [Luteibacter rhizovicinus]TCV93182.1 2'-5' RNA ligase [Luteibacter rhizovicinus]
MSRTLLALLIPEAEPLVDELRQRYDPAARRGLGAHVTLVYPFLDSEAITADVMASLRHVVAGYEALRFRLERVRTFPSTIWLAPTPAEPIQALAASIEEAFPVRPSARQSFPEFVPHITAARNVSRELSSITGVLQERLDRLGPVACHCSAVALMESRDRRWHQMTTLALS